MYDEPSYIVAAEQDYKLHKAWINEQTEAAKSQEMAFFRASIHPDNHNRIVFEVWADRPVNQGPIQWPEEWQ